jgi:hypothetical protein
MTPFMAVILSYLSFSRLSLRGLTNPLSSFNYLIFFLILRALSFFSIYLTFFKGFLNSARMGFY